MTTALGRLVEVNPSTPAFDSLADFEDVTFMPLEAVWPDGLVDTTRRAKKSAVASGYTRFDDGDILLPKITPTFEAGRVALAALATAAGAATTEVHVLRARPEVDRRYVTYACRSEPFLQEGSTRLQGVGNLRRVPTDFIRQFPVEVTELAEQRAIADFLDEQTSRIDTLIAKQTQLINTLRERRAAVISHAVTRGVRPGVAMRESGVWWIGQVPAHWSVDRLKTTIVSTQVGEWGTEPNPSRPHDDVRVVRVADFNRERRVVDFEVPTIRSVPRKDQVPRLLRRGDLIIEKSGGTALNPCGFVAMFDADYSAITSNFIARLRLKPDQLSRYWMYAHGASYGTKLTQRSVKQTTGIGNLDMASYFDERFPIPPASEQAEIVEHLDVETMRIDELIAKVGEHVELARERRAALITAAVTGQIDVRAAGRAATVDA